MEAPARIPAGRGAPAAPGGGPAATPDLGFTVEGAGALDYAAVPTLRFALRIDSEPAVRSVALNVQLRIAATRRHYAGAEEERLAEVFGRTEQWARSLGSLHWLSFGLQVPAFERSTVVDMDVPCTYDFEVTAAKYLSALEDGEVPLEFLFGGAVFYSDGGRLQVAQIGWDKEAGYRLPVAAWREAMDRHFPNSAWLRLSRESFERLYAYRARNALMGWEEAVDSLLRKAGEA